MSTDWGSTSGSAANGAGAAHQEDRHVQLVDPTQELLRVWRRWLRFSKYDGPGSDPSPRVWSTPKPENWPENLEWNTERNSVMDAEMLECIFLPAYWTPRLQLRNLKGLPTEVRRVFYPGEPGSSTALDWTTIWLLFARLQDFLETHREDGSPTFGPGFYVSRSSADGALRADTPDVPSSGNDPPTFPGIVDSFSMSISLCVQVKMLLRRWAEDDGGTWLEENVNRGLDPDSRDYVRFGCGGNAVDGSGIEERLDERLTAAMQSLRNSFVAAPIPRERWRAAGYPDPTAGDLASLREIKSRLQGRAPALRESHLFECGFSWGQVAQTDDDAGWFAEPLPYLYFTIGALDAIANVISPEVREANIFTGTQSALAAELGFLHDQTTRYWTTLSGLPGRAKGTLTIEDAPWQTFDSSTPSLYWTVYVLRAATARTDTDEFRDTEYVDRLVRVVEEVAQRARITRDPVAPSSPPTDELVRYLARRWVRETPEEGEHTPETLLKRLRELFDQPERFREELDDVRPTVLRQSRPELNDPALDLHLRGETLRLAFDDKRLGDARAWSGDFAVYDLAPQLLKVTGRLMEAAEERRVRDRLAVVRDQTWGHLLRRRFDSENPDRDGQAWDEVERLRAVDLAQAESNHVPSWYITERVVEALVAVDAAERSRPESIGMLRDTVQTVLEELRWLTTTRVDDAGSRTIFLSQLAEVEGRMDESPSVALGEALDLARKIHDQRQ